MELDPTGRIATLVMDRALAARCGGTYDDTEGLINFPLTVRDIQAVIFFKETAADDWRISMRSKGTVTSTRWPRQFGGGGHINASGCGAKGRLDDLKRCSKPRSPPAVAEAGQPPPASPRGTMNGVVVVDKPRGPTSHDVVAAARRALREKSIGHAGTLDPLATGVLALACGKATRLVRFLSASDKDYEATVRFGVATDTVRQLGTSRRRTAGPPDARGRGRRAGSLMRRAPADAAGILRQEDRRPPRLRSRPAATPGRGGAGRASRWSRARSWRWSGDEAVIRLTCSAGFYVRTLAHEIGQLVGTGACLSALRRTRSGSFTLAAAVRWTR